MEINIQIKLVDSLEKVFPLDEPRRQLENETESTLINEIYSFQVAYIANFEKQNFCLEAQGSGCEIKLYNVGLVPSELPAYPEHDDGYIKTEPGLYPDVLYPINKNDTLFAQPNFWRAIWVECMSQKAGTCHTIIKFKDSNGELLTECEKTFEIMNCKLPEQELIHTEWLHCDCISNYYAVPMMSEAHWKLIERYICFAAESGINTILTPVFTPPLDTKIGDERPTMQLVNVAVEKGNYFFGFKELKRWIDMCISCGIKYFEISHLFTQWGAKHAPKIEAQKNGKMQQIFGWQTKAAGKEYKEFLSAFLPELTQKLKEWGVAERCFFHISDEPKIKDFDSYKSAKKMVSCHLQGFKIIDALSDIEFYNEGLVENPICATNHVKPFLDAGTKNLWVYYCCAQNMKVSNRFMAMPSARNRIIGIQLYKYNISGFLHWGYNFWNTQYSLKSIDPYKVTDGGCSFPSGDAFLVYPLEKGPIPSIRLKIFQQALYDLRALKLLEDMTSREFVIDLLESDLDEPITFDKYPVGEEYIQRIRKKVNSEIKGSRHSRANK